MSTQYDSFSYTRSDLLNSLTSSMEDKSGNVYFKYFAAHRFVVGLFILCRVTHTRMHTHTYIHTYIPTHIHIYIHIYKWIHSTDPVSASIACEYGTCQ